MNGQSLIGGAGDASPVPHRRDDFGNKAGEAASGGVSQLKLALTSRPPEQVSNCGGPAWLQCHPRGAPHRYLFRRRRLFLVAVISCMCCVHDLSAALKRIELRVQQMGPPCGHPALQHGSDCVLFSHGTLQSVLPNQTDHT
uniref:Solute carrier family 14 member 1 (Kidd blood group) n=1 Tax=Molossus molossus TaxID=27622 RepID=A0A7J8HLB2_MOLMO|nr:solute carrier family 14 member 1 (Kidd blood group) [Molossus molossus]